MHCAPEHLWVSPRDILEAELSWPPLPETAARGVLQVGAESVEGVVLSGLSFLMVKYWLSALSSDSIDSYASSATSDTSG